MPAANPAHQTTVVAQVCSLIARADLPPSLGDLARAVGLSRSGLHRMFKAVTGLTPRAYAAGVRAERARERLSGGATVTEALYDAGYNASSRFYAEAVDQLGMRPASFRDGGRREVIRFAVAQTSLGAVIVGATARGICTIQLGDEPDGLVRAFQDRFSRATLIGADAEFEKVVARVIGLIEMPGAAHDLPLDVQGTAFQRRVWDALRAIPPGQTASYNEVAIRIGQPTAARAVAGACAANPVAVAIPCHRVVRADGDVSGYRWGVERKRALLASERPPSFSGADRDIRALQSESSANTPNQG